MTRTPELNLPLTETALYALRANMQLGEGQHYTKDLEAGDVALQLGTDVFDQTEHELSDIDPTLEEAAQTGRPHVPTGLARRPFMVNIVLDKMLRTEDMVFRNQKSTVASQLARAVGDSVPHLDPINGKVLTDTAVEHSDFRHVVKANSRADGTKKIQWLALSGLALVISDFSKMEFLPGSMRNVVAIKANHLFEREVPLDLGPIVLGGDIELVKRRDKKNYNRYLADEHEKTVCQLTEAGAHVVSVVVDGRLKPHGFDVDGTDAQLAKAIEVSS